MQREIPLGPLPTYQMQPVPQADLATMVESWSACNTAWVRRQPKKAIADFAEDWGTTKGEVSRRVNERFPRSLQQILEFERMTRCPALTQWLAHQHGMALVPREISEEERTQVRIAELEAELEKARAAA